MQEGLESLLDDVRSAALRGDLSDLARLAPQIDDAARVAQSGGGNLPPSVRAKARRTAAVLTATAGGIRSALGRLDDIVSGPILSTYDATGRKAAIAMTSAKPPHRV